MNENEPQKLKKITDIEVSSEYLQNFFHKPSNILQLNSLEQRELISERFYVKNLNFAPSLVNCGSLLKDWKAIPGRETTPPRTELIVDKTEMESIKKNEEILPKIGNISPDLFESDCEENFESNSIEKSFTNIESNFDSDELFESQKGILHFESFCKDSEAISQNYIDLTQSSDDENPEIFKELSKEKSFEMDPVFNENLEQEEENEELFKNGEVGIEEKSFEETFRTENLNVTDYINKILNENESNDFDEEVAGYNQNHSQSNMLTKPGDNENFCISDEEANKNTEKSAENERNSPKLEFIVRTTNVTPLPDFERMDTPTITNELNKIGVKPMKRKTGVKLLKHIYEATHPFLNEISHNKQKIEEKSSIEIIGDIVQEK